MAEVGATPIFAAKNFSYQYPFTTIKALDGVTFAVNRREFVAIVGPSGCGKSTLLRVIGQLALECPSVDLPLDPALVKSGKIGMMFQTTVLFPWMSVWKNLLFPLELATGLSMTSSEVRSRAEGLLQKVGLADFSQAYHFQLSGGMQQRLCLARSLLLKPEILLLDEPFGALDAMTREELNGELQRLWLEEQPTVVLITHDIAEAVYLADRIVVMSARPGRIKATVPVNLPRTAGGRDRFSAEFNRLAEQVHALL